MKNTKVKRWHIITIGVLLSALCIAFAACGDTATKETDAPESVTTTTITEITTDTTAETTTTAVTTKTTSTTAQTTETKTEKATTTVKAAEPLAEKKTTAPKQDTPAPKKTTAKPAQPTPTKTTAAPKGHYETVHHEAVTEQVWVVDTAASEKIVVECYCSQRFNSIDEWDRHSDAAWINNGDDSHWGYNYWYETVPEQGHYETKVIQAAYDEQVWVQD